MFQNYSICDCASPKIQTVVQVIKENSFIRHNRIPDSFNDCYGDLVLFRNVFFDVPMIVVSRSKFFVLLFEKDIILPFAFPLLLLFLCF